MSASHSKKFSSFIGPAMIPSGGFKVNSTTKMYTFGTICIDDAFGDCLIQASKSEKTEGIEPPIAGENGLPVAWLAPLRLEATEILEYTASYGRACTRTC